MERVGVQYLNPRALVAAALIAVVAFAIGGVAVLFVPLGGSSLPPPAEVIATSAQRFRDEPESIEGTFSTEVKMEELEVRADGEFAFIAPDRMHITIDSSGTTMEILLTGGESYLRLADEDDWYRLEGYWEGLDPDTLKLFLEARGFLHYGNLADRLLRLEQLPDERLDDRKYLHYWGFVEFRDLADVLPTGLTGQALVSADPGLDGEPAETHLWLDRDTFLPHRVEIHGEWTLDEVTLTQSLTFEFDTYGGDVAVPETPADAKRLVQSLQPGGILGLRCSYATKFLRERYGLPEGRGCVVLRVDSPSAAEEAGFQLGDKMIEMDGMHITSGRQFSFLFEDLPGTGHHTFVVQRGDQEITLEVDLADRAGAPKEDPYLYYLQAKGLAADSIDLDADFDQIIADFTRAIEQDPEFELPYLYRGDMQIGKDDEAARTDLEQALSLDPTLTEAHRALAQLAERQYDFDAAIEHINRSIELNGCGEALEPWDLDCAEDLTNRTAFYLSRLNEGDDVIVERSLDALEGVTFCEPMLVWGRLSLAFAHGDDAAVRELGERFIDMPLTRLSDYLRFHQVRLEEWIIGGEGWTAFAMPTWNVGPVSAIQYPQDETTIKSVTVSGFHLTYNVDLPSSVEGSTVSGDLWRGPYRVAAFTLPDTSGQYVQANFDSTNTNLPDGEFELRVYVDGQPVKTLVLEATREE
jgi:tetratricopeptide (TPR) repeat protein